MTTQGRMTPNKWRHRFCPVWHSCTRATQFSIPTGAVLWATLDWQDDSGIQMWEAPVLVSFIGHLSDWEIEDVTGTWQVRLSFLGQFLSVLLSLSVLFSCSAALFCPGDSIFSRLRIQEAAMFTSQFFHENLQYFVLN